MGPESREGHGSGKGGRGPMAVGPCVLDGLRVRV